jgi:ATP-dependent DNA helicase Q4
VRTVLRRDLDVHCILGLTATATKQAIESVCSLLELDPQDDVIRMNAIPPNLILSVSKDSSRKKALFELLSRPPYADLDGIIIYCLRQADTDEVARYLRTVGTRQVESYHAGKTAKERTDIQQSFFSGKLSILCATIAFGLGINKANVRAVIHYSLPKSLENYVQVRR